MGLGFGCGRVGGLLAVGLRLGWYGGAGEMGSGGEGGLIGGGWEESLVLTRLGGDSGWEGVEWDGAELLVFLVGVVGCVC